MRLAKYRLGDLIEPRVVENVDLEYGSDDVRGVNNLKQLMSTKADILNRDLTKFQIVAPGDFVFNHRTSRNGSKFSIAYNDTDASIKVCLIKNGYPPQYSPEVFQKVMEQVENFVDNR